MLEPDKMSKTQRRDVDKKVFSMKWKTVNSNSELGCSHVELWTNTGKLNIIIPNTFVVGIIFVHWCISHCSLSYIIFTM